MTNGDAEYTRLHDVLLADLMDEEANVEQDIVNLRVRLAEIQEAKKAFTVASSHIQRVLGKVKSELDERPLTPEEIHNKSQREVLGIIAKRNDGWLVAQSAIRLMVAASVLVEDGASAQIYTVLRQAPEFIQVVPGIYRLRSTRHKPIEAKSAVSQRLPKGTTPTGSRPRSHGQSEKSGLVDKVASLLAQHPEWKPRDLRKELQREGWDFGGKHPSFSVSMAYANYVKRSRKLTGQQPPLINP